MILSLLNGASISIEGLIAIFVFAPCAGISWANIGKIEPRRWIVYLFVLAPLMFVTGVFSALEIYLIWASQRYGLSPAKPVSASAFELNVFPALALIAFASSMWAFFTVIALGKAKICPSTKDAQLFTQVFILLKKHWKCPKVQTSRVERINMPLGWLFGIAGFLLLISSVSPLRDFVSSIDSGGPFLLIGSLCSSVGIGALIRSRRYFQAKLDARLTEDKPVLFLRSFSDDDHTKFVQDLTSLIDYSFETRLADYFSHYGPFIAISSPEDESLQIGAARVRLSDQDWQNWVRQCMEASLAIVVIAGTTHWVTWELTQIFEKRYEKKLVVLFPPDRKTPLVQQTLDRLRGLHHNAPRLACLKEALAQTQWSWAVSSIRDCQTLCAITFDAIGRITVIRSTSRNRDAHHLATIIAHYFTLFGSRTNNNFATIQEAN
jgi:hypothetical protein